MRKNSVGNRFPAGVPVISLGVSSIVANEGQTLSITINRTASPLVSTCRFYTVPQTAGNDDFTEHEGTLVTFAAGETSKQVNVTISADALNEADENFYVQVANPSMATIGAVNKALVTITGQVQIVTVASVSSPTVNEGAPLVFNVVLSAPTNQSTNFSYVLGGTASNILDYTNTPSFSSGVTLSGAVLTVPSGVSVFTVTFPTVDDTALEGPETVILNVGGVQGTGTINSDDVAIQSVFTDANVTEGLPLVFNVILTAAPTVAKTFTFSRSGTATVGSDFSDSPTFSNGVVLSAGQINVPIGVSEFTVSYPTINDSLDEPQETIVLTIGGVQGTGIILSDDGVLPAFSVRLIEAPYFALTAPQRSGLSDNDGFVMALVERNIAGLVSPNYNLRVSSDNITYSAIGDANYAPMGYLLNAVNKTVESFVFSSAVDMNDIVFGAAKVLGYIDDEVVEVTAYNATTRTVTVRRGVADTVPQAHEIGSKLYIAVPNIGKDPTEYVVGNIRYYKALPKSGASTYPEVSALSNMITLAARAGRPYPPNLFKINGEYYPTSVLAGDITVSWQNRNRLTQITDLIDYNDVVGGGGGGGVTAINVSDNTGATVGGTEDSELNQFNPTTNDGANGQAYLDAWATPDNIVTLAMRFPIPAGAGTVSGSKLRLYLTEKSGVKTALSVYQLLRTDWSESQSTFNIYKTGSNWTTPGAQGVGTDRGATAIATADVAAIATGNYVEFTGAGLDALIQNAITNSLTSVNLLVQYTDLTFTSANYVRFVTSEGTNGQRPELVYNLTGAGGPFAGEVGQTHTVQFFDGDTLVREVTGITGNEYVYTNANIIADGDYDIVRVKLFSVRGGVTSLAAHEHTFTRPFTGVPTVTVINISGGVEGGNAVFTVVLSGPYVDQVDHPYTLTGNFQLADINAEAITFSNDVENNGDGTLLVPAGVDTFTVTIPIVTDALAETGENITLTMGTVSNTINLTNA